MAALGSHSLQYGLAFLHGFPPVVVADNTAQSTVIIDARDYESLTFVFHTGTLADADMTAAVAVLAGDTVDSVSAPTTITDEAAADANCLIGTGGLAGAGFTFADDNAVKAITYRPATGAGKRWVRATWTPSANTGNAPVSCIVLGKKRGGP